MQIALDGATRKHKIVEKQMQTFWVVFVFLPSGILGAYMAFPLGNICLLKGVIEALWGNYWFMLVSLVVELSCVLVGISKWMNEPGKFMVCMCLE